MAEVRPSVIFCPQIFQWNDTSHLASISRKHQGSRTRSGFFANQGWVYHDSSYLTWRAPYGPKKLSDAKWPSLFPQQTTNHGSFCKECIWVSVVRFIKGWSLHDSRRSWASPSLDLASSAWARVAHPSSKYSRLHFSHGNNGKSMEKKKVVRYSQIGVDI